MITFAILCNIFLCGAIIFAMMVGAMAEIAKQTNNDELVLKARSDTDALGRLYDLYYDRIFRFCVHRLFVKETAEDVTSAVFLDVASRIRSFSGRSEQDFRNWLYAIAANQINAYIRKASRRKKLLAEAASSMMVSGLNSTNDMAEWDWPMLYTAILKLKPEHQTIVTLRFFEGMEFEEIGRIIHSKTATVRVTLHRTLKQLRNHLQTILDGEK
jgi:RNA polymerase sigma-70 factor (ECF subfamily)